MLNLQEAASMTFPQNPAIPDASQAWEAVLRRDRSARDFVYAVTTTGVFCRSGCPSRRPARENVRFFSDAAAALAAGFRACQRCRPQAESPDAATVKKLAAHLDGKLDRAVPLAELGRIAACSPFTAQRLFRRVLGVTPAQYQRQARAAALRAGLGSGSTTATAALYAAGYSNSSRAYEAANHTLGMRPGEFRSKGKGLNIRYSIVDSQLGLVLVARTAKGVCAVALGDSRDELLHELQDRFRAAEIIEDPSLDATLAAVIRSCGGDSAALLDLPLDLRATAFQMQVWEALRRIPAGETRSYAAVAAALGNPRAVRAVARACASNPAALLVPCHRVIGSDGKLTGYRWGVERKKKLLALERAAAGQRPATSPR
jgi:AraC family transcriptional regulator, regulatory protein of adaptative response / methylated-DNA-[protein]-cysteine methyltransferase